MAARQKFNPLTGMFDLVSPPEFKVFNTVVEARGSDPTGASSNICYIVETEALYLYCEECGLPDDGDLVIETVNGGATRWEMIQKVSRTQGDSGWIDRAGLLVTRLNATTLRAAVSAPCFFAVNSTRKTIPVGNYDISFTGVGRVIYVSLDKNGNLTQGEDVQSLFRGTPVAAVFWTGTSIGGVQTEFHGIRDSVWHAWAHKYLSTQYTSGLSITTDTQPDTNGNPTSATAQYLWLTTGVIHDEDTAIDIGTGNWLQDLGTGLTDTTAAVIPFFYYNGIAVVGRAANADRVPFLYTGATGTPQREVNGVLTNASNGDYVVYHYFASPFIGGYSVFARPHNNVDAYTTLIAARAARPSELTWSSIGEFKHLYSVVFRVGNFASTPHNCKVVDVQDFRQTSSGPAGGFNATSHAALSGLTGPNVHPASSIYTDTVPFLGELSAEETTVQLALTRLSEFDTVLDHAAGKAYRVGNTVKVTDIGYEGVWRCVTPHTSAASFVTGQESGYWEFLASWLGPREYIDFGSAPGFSVGDVVVYAGGTVMNQCNAADESLAYPTGLVCARNSRYIGIAKSGGILNTQFSTFTVGKNYLSDALPGGMWIEPPAILSKIVLLGNATSETSFSVDISHFGTNKNTGLVSVANGYSAVLQFSGSMLLIIEVGSGSILICADATSSTVSALSDPSGLFLSADSGVGIFVGKLTNDILFIKNRMGVSRNIGIQLLTDSATYYSSWDSL